MRMVAKRLKAVIQKRKANNTIRPSPDILNFHLVGRLSRAVLRKSQYASTRHNERLAEAGIEALRRREGQLRQRLGGDHQRATRPS